MAVDRIWITETVVDMDEFLHLNTEEKIQVLHELIKDTFPRSASVKIFVNCEGIEATPEYRTNISGYSMMDIDNEWITKNDSK